MPTIAEMARNIQASLRALANNYVLPIVMAGAPTSGTSGTGAGYCGPGTLLINISTGAVYFNSNTKVSPTWSQLGSVAALTSGHLFVGNGSNVGTDVAASGDVTLANTGAFTVATVGGATAAQIFAASQFGVARAVFNPSATAGDRTVAAHTFAVTIPDKSIVVGGVVQVNTLFTSTNSTATIAISIQSANDIVTAAAVSGAPWSTTGLKAITPKINTPETTGIALTADRLVTATVAVEALLTGKATINLIYLVGA